MRLILDGHWYDVNNSGKKKPLLRDIKSDACIIRY